MGYYANHKLIEIINEVVRKIKNKKTSTDDHDEKNEKDQNASLNR